MSTYQERDGVRTIILYTTDNGVTWLPDPTGGLIVMSPNGSLFGVVVSDAGVLSASPL